jgi:multidrug resistance protein
MIWTLFGLQHESDFDLIPLNLLYSKSRFLAVLPIMADPSSTFELSESWSREPVDHSRTLNTGNRHDETTEKDPSISHLTADSSSSIITTHSTTATSHTPTEIKDVEAQPHILEPEIANPSPIPVPRSHRRGLLATLTLIPEVIEPKDYPRPRKWFLTFVVALAAVAAPMGSAIFFPSLAQVAEDLHTTPTVANLSVAFYMLSLAIFPLWWSSFSETLGRRTIYIVSFSMFLVFNILSAVAMNIGWLLVTRILAGGAAGSVQAVGAGTIADIWEPRERGKAMGIFYLGPLMGPLLAPIIGGALALKWGWRATQWFMVFYGAAVLIFLIFMLPETLKDPKSLLLAEDDVAGGIPLSRTTSGRRSVHVKSKRAIKFLKRAFLDPLKIITYLRYPAVLLTVYYASVTFTALYILNISLQATFSLPASAGGAYHFSTFEVGLAYIPNSIGYVLASLFGGKWNDNIMAREARRANRYDAQGKLVYRPEDRMRENAWIAAFLWPAALLWYGWTADKHVFWAVPLAANFFYGVGSMIIFAMATTMLTEFMPRRASNGVALNNFVRNTCACIGGVVAQPLITAVGNGWLFTALGVLGAASSVVIWAMRRFGPRWRRHMEEHLE